jgi:hypothetical protein
MKVNEIILEASLGRVWQHFNNPDMSVAILTAFRGRDLGDESLDDSELYQRNVSRNRKLVSQLEKRGYGYIYVDGHWIENQGTPEERLVKEDSVFVAVKNAGPDFAEFIHQLGNSFNQDAVVVKDSKGTRLIFKDGSEIPLGNIKPGQLGDIYTKLRNNKQANTFVFESERTELGWVARLAGANTLRAKGYRGI